MQLLPVITSDRIATLASPVTGLFGADSRVCLADVYDHTGQLHMVYLKVTAPEKTIIAGDVVRWLIGSTMSVPMPSQAYLCQVPIAMVEALWPELPWRQWWQRDLIPGFASENLGGSAPPTPVALVNDADLIADLKAWEGLLPTMALDEWLANADDNLSNLIQLMQSNGEIDFATLDGGQILGSDEWTINAVKRLIPPSNSARRHSKLGRAVYGTMPPLDVLQRLLKLSRRHSAALEFAMPHLYYWLSELLDDVPLTELVIECISRRADLPWISQRQTLAYST